MAILIGCTLLQKTPMAGKPNGAARNVKLIGIALPSLAAVLGGFATYISSYVTPLHDQIAVLEQRIETFEARAKEDRACLEEQLRREMCLRLEPIIATNKMLVARVIELECSDKRLAEFKGKVERSIQPRGD